MSLTESPVENVWMVNGERVHRDTYMKVADLEVEVERLRATAKEVLRTQGHADEAGGTIDEQVYALKQLEAVLDAHAEQKVDAQ